MTTIDLSGFEQEIEKAEMAIYTGSPAISIIDAKYIARAAITAFLTAAIESGKAKNAYHDVIPHSESEEWRAQSNWLKSTYTFPALILKLEPKP